MELTELIRAPDPTHLRLWWPLLVGLEFVLGAFVGVALVSTALSLAYRRAHPALARDFALVVSGQAGVWLTLGLLPLLTLSVLYAQLLHDSRYRILDALVLLWPLATTGLAALWLYRQRLNPLLGAAGILALLGFVPPFVNLLDFFRRPEQWPLWNPLLPDLYNHLVLPRLAIFGAGAVLATGAALLGVYFAWPERRPTAPALRVWAVVLTHLGALALPALVVWDFALPAWGVQSVAPVTASAVMFGLLWAVALGSGLQLLGGHARRAGLWALVALAALALETNRQQAVRMHAVADRVALVRLEGEQRAAAQKLAQEARYPSNVPLDPQAGERIYAEKCASCHSFNQKVVGPAHKDVVPKYGGDAAKLAAFILNPTKVDPSFPAMPAQGLSRREAQAVAEYLLAKVPAGGGKP